MAEKEYIDREILLKMNFYTANCNSEENRWNDYAIKDIIRHIPATDVVPVKHARNLATQFDETICTNCGVHLGEVLRIVREDNGDDAVNYYQPKYCANCGAKFDGDVSNVGNN